MQTKVALVGNYGGHSVKINKIVSLNLKFPYSEIVNYVKTLQFISENITVKTRIGDGKPRQIGIFSFNGLKIDRDGEAVITLNSTHDCVEMQNLDELIDCPLIKVLFTADIDADEEKEEEEE